MIKKFKQGRVLEKSETLLVFVKGAHIMDIKDIKPNSHKYKAEQKTATNTSEKKVEKVIKGTAKVKKKNGIQKAASNFIAEEASNIKTYLINDVLIPTIKNTIWDAFTNSLDMILFNGSKHAKKKSSGGYVSYRSYYDKDDRHSSSARTRSQFDYDDIIFETKGEALAVRDQMDDLIDRYGFVTVADMYDMVDISAPYTSNKYGWTNIRNAEPVRVREGYILKLPRAYVID